MNSASQIRPGESATFVASVAALVDRLRALAAEMPAGEAGALSAVVDAFVADVEPLLEFPNAVVNPPLP